MERRKPKVSFDSPQGESMTKQSFRDECDINVLMRRYEKTGLLDHVNTHQGDYGDFINAPDFHTAMNQILTAEHMFQSLPARIRARFANDPGAFLEFAQNPENADEMAELGLIPAPGPSEPDTEPVAESPAPPPETAPKRAQEAAEAE